MGETRGIFGSPGAGKSASMRLVYPPSVTALAAVLWDTSGGIRQEPLELLVMSVPSEYRDWALSDLYWMATDLTAEGQLSREEIAKEMIESIQDVSPDAEPAQRLQGLFVAAASNEIGDGTFMRSVSNDLGDNNGLYNDIGCRYLLKVVVDPPYAANAEIGALKHTNTLPQTQNHGWIHCTNLYIAGNHDCDAHGFSTRLNEALARDLPGRRGPRDFLIAVDGLEARLALSTAPDRIVEATRSARVPKGIGEQEFRTARNSNVLSKLKLSPRERQVLVHLCSGKSEKQIATALKVSRHTIHAYVRSVYRKCGASTRGELYATIMKRILAAERPAETSRAKA